MTLTSHQEYTGNRHMLPNFLVCGAAQSGTSFLYSSLFQHPEIFVPEKATPEPHFFLKDWEYEKGLDAYLAQWFSGVSGEKACGEKSSSYLYGGRKVARRIFNDLPDVRLVIMLRNPVERTWAHYRFTALNGLEPLDFEQALEQEQERNASATGQWATIKPFDYTGRSLYGRQLSDFLEIFPEDRVLVLQAESFRKSPLEGFEKLFGFLGVSTDFKPEMAPRFTSPRVIDPAAQARYRSFFGDRFSEILRDLRGNSPDLSHHTATKTEQEMLEKLKANLTDKAQDMPEAARQRLVAIFRHDLELLQSMVDFPVDGWFVK